MSFQDLQNPEPQIIYLFLQDNGQFSAIMNRFIANTLVASFWRCYTTPPGAAACSPNWNKWGKTQF